MRSIQIFSSVFAFAISVAAWEPYKAPMHHDVAAIQPRQTTTYDLSFSATQGNTATTVASAPSGSQSGIFGNRTTTTGSPSFDPRLPAGGISMITPNPMTTQYYKIDDYVTFVWNYTSLSITPTAVDILASCSSNQMTYTLALNQSITAATQAFTWDTGDFQSTASATLLTGQYTLIVHDAAKDVSATPQAGYLGTANQFTFGMYVPQEYISIQDGWQCVTCKRNAALSSIEKQTLGFVLGMVVTTVISFSWFAGVAGLW